MDAQFLPLVSEVSSHRGRWNGSRIRCLPTGSAGSVRKVEKRAGDNKRERRGCIRKELWVESSPRPHCSSPAGIAIDPKPQILARQLQEEVVAF